MDPTLTVTADDSAAATFVPLIRVAGRLLTWHGGGPLSRHAVVRAGEDTVAELKLPLVVLHGAAVARTAEGSWVLDPSGFLQRRIEVKAEEGGAPAGVFHVPLVARGGRWEPAHGPALTWRQHGLLPLRYSLVDETGSTLMVFRRRWRRGEVEVRPPGLARPDAGFLVALGVFVVLWTARRRASSGGGG